jgi:hypothetical protein
MEKKIIAALAALAILGGSAAGWAWNAAPAPAPSQHPVAGWAWNTPPR